MAIEKRGSSFQVTINHRGQRFRRQFPDLNAAQVWEAESKAAQLKGELPAMGAQAKATDRSKPRTMGELYDYVWEHRWKMQRAAKSTEINAKEVVAIIGATTLISRVDVFTLDKVVNVLRKKQNANGTINRKLAALSKMLSVAVDLEIIDRKPKLPKQKESERRRFRIDHDLETKILAFFGQLGQEDMRDYVIFSLDTGLRQSEALGLRWEQQDGRVITIYGEDAKSYKSRSVPMTERVKELMARRFKAARNTHDLLRHPVLGGLTKRTVQYYWGLLREHLGLEENPSFVPHILRHEFCSRIADTTGNAVAVMKLAGHSNLVVSQRYINLAATGLDSAIAALDKAREAKSDNA